MRNRYLPMLYTAYYYDNAKDQGFAGDTNQLSVNGKLVSLITEVRSSTNLAELMPRTETEDIVLIVSSDTRIDIDNYNPCPDDLDY